MLSLVQARENSSSESDHDIEQLEPPAKKECTESDKGKKYRFKASKREYSIPGRRNLQ